MQVELWYTAASRLPTPDDPSAPLPFDRTTHIQRLFFDIFADENCEPPMLDYKNMVSLCIAIAVKLQEFMALAHSFLIKLGL